MDLISLGSLLGIIGLLGERVFKSIRKSRCTHIHSKCCGSEIDIERDVEQQDHKNENEEK
jgi:hypothetical protein|tara:strand:- start:4275 stop:4454 length:180 start_codon:yes stop_codon:yes gene_type:complete